MTRYLPRPSWSLITENERLAISGGADEILVAEAMDPDSMDQFREQWRAGVIEPDRLPPGCRPLVQQLIAAGILDGAPDPDWNQYRLLWAGDELPDLAARLAELSRSRTLAEDDAAPFAVVVRSNATLLAAAHIDLTVPHLLVDLAYHHTISLGPLVLPPDTACLGCLAGRLRDAWGDPLPPPEPSMTAEPELAAALVMKELRAVQAGSIALANRTVAYNFREHEVLSSSLFKLPWCPRCGSRGEDRDHG